MGAWGTGSFENDTALDWLEEFTATPDEEFIRKSLTAIGTRLDTDEGCIVLATSEVIAAKLGQSSPGLPQSAVSLLEKLATPSKDVVELAMQRLVDVLDSELAALWEETEEHKQWLNDVQDLSKRLKICAGNSQKRPKNRSQAKGANDQEAKSFEAQRRRAEQGNSTSMYYLAERFLEGRGTPPSVESALEWFEKAGLAGEPYAFLKLGEIYKKGKLVSRDVKKALKYFLSTADADVACPRINSRLRLSDRRDLYELIATLYRKDANTISKNLAEEWDQKAKSVPDRHTPEEIAQSEQEREESLKVAQKMVQEEREFEDNKSRDAAAKK